jgi:bifunctional enzyme CysN/CysC
MGQRATSLSDFERYFSEQMEKSQLRFITCGSVDNGKSTLLGRLLYESNSVFEDQLEAARVESERYGAHGKSLDMALLIDGLQDEREQGITIDVAYRYFETKKRKFIAIDAPGHEQFTRNMITGASNADLAIVLIDATQGVLKQTRRHSLIVSMVGIRNVVLAINKMDLVGFDQCVFNQIESEYSRYAEQLDITSIYSVPVSALAGDNIFQLSKRTPWYLGEPLISLLEDATISSERTLSPFRFPVQSVNRPTPDFRGYSGTVMSGSISLGDTIASSATSGSSQILEILGPSGNLAQAIAGQAVTLRLAHELEISRGDILAMPSSQPDISDQFAANVFWMGEEPMMPGRQYVFRFNMAESRGNISDLSALIDIDTLNKHSSKVLRINEIGYCKISLWRDVAFDPFDSDLGTGAFVMIDRYTNATVGAGTITHGLDRGRNIKWHAMQVNKSARAELNRQKPCVVWLTGLSGSGKSSIADILERKLHAMGLSTYLLDGDNVRHGLCKDLGFTDSDRVENIRRVAEVAKLMVDAGLIVITAFISPFKAERQMARDLFDVGEFFEVFVNTPLSVCEARDAKGLYEKARKGVLKNFTGISSVYEPPQVPEVNVDGASENLDEIADRLISIILEPSENVQ